MALLPSNAETKKRNRAQSFYYLISWQHFRTIIMLSNHHTEQHNIYKRKTLHHILCLSKSERLIPNELTLSWMQNSTRCETNNYAQHQLEQDHPKQHSNSIATQRLPLQQETFKYQHRNTKTPQTYTHTKGKVIAIHLPTPQLENRTDLHHSKLDKLYPQPQSQYYLITNIATRITSHSSIDTPETTTSIKPTNPIQNLQTNPTLLKVKQNTLSIKLIQSTRYSNWLLKPESIYTLTQNLLQHVMCRITKRHPEDYKIQATTKPTQFQLK